MSRWKTFNTENALEIRNDPGVYVFYDLSRKVLYIGSSAKVGNRVRGHYQIGYGSDVQTKKWGTFDDIVIKVSYSRKYGDWAMRELRLIRKLKPLFNQLHQNR